MTAGRDGLCQNAPMQRTRRVGAAVLAVLGVVLLLASSYGWWAKRYFLDSARFTAKADQILDEPAVQDALAVAITDEISAASGRDLRIAQPFVATIVGEIVESSQFRAVFDAAVSRLHRAVVGGGARDAVLDLSAIVDEVRDALEPVAPDLADEIPSGERVRVTLLDETQLETIYDTTNLIEDIVIGLTVATVIVLGAAIALSPRRWRTLALAGWVTLGVFVVSLLVVRVGRSVVGSFPDRSEYADAAEAAYRVITRGLVVQGLVFAVMGLLVGLGASWTDRNGGWAAIQRAVRDAVAWIRAQVPRRAPAPAGAAPEAVVATAAPTAAPDAGGRVEVAGVLAPRLPEPHQRPRTVRWWRAAALVVLGLFAILSPGSLTTVVVVLLGVVALYLAVTEALAAWATPRDTPRPGPDPAGDETEAPARS